MFFNEPAPADIYTLSLHDALPISTDARGYKAVENVLSIHDLHATILHLLGLDHRALTFRHNGVERRLTDVHGHVIKEILA